ncbi:hypothetical protein G032_20960 [Pectobacterium carotovorum subsp. carotovorum ICMP 5702]|nr:hypothetical protein G032_20960 [Pectobacterium carotovorum subsp. carotovorum ICMP 5702]
MLKRRRPICANRLALCVINYHTREIIKMTNEIVQLAQKIVNKQPVRIPAMKMHQWDDLRWWMDYLRGYAL